MFEALESRLRPLLQRMGGQARLDDRNMAAALEDVHRALLEADVALEVVRQFTDSVRQGARGQEVSQSLKPGQEFIRIVRAELEKALGEGDDFSLQLSVVPPAVIMLAGLQGSGKTTSAAKLGHWLRSTQKRVLLASTDVYRPAAMEQLQLLADQAGCSFWRPTGRNPQALARSALKQARRSQAEVLILDTAGRLHVDEEMMAEARRIHDAVSPAETLFVVDAMMGQDAVVAARAFSQNLTLSGVVLSKADADSRGGAALSVRWVTGCPIKFMGMGEKIQQWEPFDPGRLAARILGMGDVLGLVEEVQKNVDQKKARKLAAKLTAKRGFDLEDLREQLSQIQSMGGIGNLLDKLPGMSGDMKAMAAQRMDSALSRKMVAIIDSMTVAERRRPELLNGSRKRRICLGSGTSLQDLHRLLKQYKQVQKAGRQLGRKGKGMRKLARGLSALQGGLPES